MRVRNASIDAISLSSIWHINRALRPCSEPQAQTPKIGACFVASSRLNLYRHSSVTGCGKPQTLRKIYCEKSEESRKCNFIVSAFLAVCASRAAPPLSRVFARRKPRVCSLIWRCIADCNRAKFWPICSGRATNPEPHGTVCEWRFRRCGGNSKAICRPNRRRANRYLRRRVLPSVCARVPCGATWLHSTKRCKTRVTRPIWRRARSFTMSPPRFIQASFCPDSTTIGASKSPRAFRSRTKKPRNFCLNTARPILPRVQQPR